MKHAHLQHSSKHPLHARRTLRDYLLSYCWEIGLVLGRLSLGEFHYAMKLVAIAQEGRIKIGPDVHAVSSPLPKMTLSQTNRLKVAPAAASEPTSVSLLFLMVEGGAEGMQNGKIAVRWIAW
jgi:hypothetical protein